MKIKSLVTVAALCAFAFPALAENAPAKVEKTSAKAEKAEKKPMAKSTVVEGITNDDITFESIADQAILDKAEKYINGMTTLKAKLVQATSTGESAEGMLYIQRPGKMRLEYDPPTPVLVLSNGNTMIYYDSKLEQVSHVKLESTPAHILIKEKLSFHDKKLAITNVYRQPGAIEIGVKYADENIPGYFTLIFSEEPFVLRQWRVRDAQGITTSVGLFEIEEGMKLDPELFKFKDPRRKMPGEIGK